jgi:hypothetical protein
MTAQQPPSSAAHVSDPLFTAHPPLRHPTGCHFHQNCTSTGRPDQPPPPRVTPKPPGPPLPPPPGTMDQTPPPPFLPLSASVCRHLAPHRCPSLTRVTCSSPMRSPNSPHSSDSDLPAPSTVRRPTHWDLTGPLPFPPTLPGEKYPPIGNSST